MGGAYRGNGLRTSIIAPGLFNGARTPAFFLLPRREGAERRKALRSSSAPCGAARRVTGTRASRRSTAAILGQATVTSFNGPEASTSRDPGRIGAALHPMLSKPLKAGPSSGPDGDPASRSVVTTHGCGRRLPAPPTERLRKTPSTEQGMPSIQRFKNGTRIIRISVFARWGWSLKRQWIQRVIDTGHQPFRPIARQD